MRRPQAPPNSPRNHQMELDDEDGASLSTTSELTMLSDFETSEEEPMTETDESDSSYLDVNSRARVPGISRVMLNFAGRSVSRGFEVLSHPEDILSVQKEAVMTIGSIARRMVILSNLARHLNKEDAQIWMESVKRLCKEQQRLTSQTNISPNGAFIEDRFVPIENFCRNPDCVFSEKSLSSLELLELGKQDLHMNTLCGMGTHGCPALLICGGLMAHVDALMRSLMTIEETQTLNGCYDCWISTLSEFPLKVDLLIGNQTGFGSLPIFTRVIGTLIYLTLPPLCDELRRSPSSLPDLNGKKCEISFPPRSN